MAKYMSETTSNSLKYNQVKQRASSTQDLELSSLIPKTIIELDKHAFSYNINQIKKIIGPTELAIVLKSNAYGHGIKEIACMSLEENHVKWLCTAGISEALILKKCGIKKPIIVLSFLDADLEEAINLDIHCPVYNIEDAYALSQAAQNINKQAFVHIKVDTGMSRLGISPEDIINFIRSVNKLPNIKVFGIFTHLCDTPNPDQRFSYQQLETFDKVLDVLENAGIHIPCTHAQSSSSLCIIPKRQYTLLRAGAAIYGVWKSDQHRNLILDKFPEYNLKPVLTWKTKVIQLKTISTGSTVGYDRTFTATKPMTIAVLPVGYWDGYNRGFSNNGVVIVNGQLAPVIGIVSMNLTIIDVTGIKNVQLGNEVILLGEYTQLTAQYCASKAKIITNELIVQLNSDIKRIICT